MSLENEKKYKKTPMDMHAQAMFSFPFPFPFRSNLIVKLVCHFSEVQSHGERLNAVWKQKIREQSTPSPYGCRKS